MRLILLVLVCLAHTAFSLYFEKTRFDRSLRDNIQNINEDEPIKKQWTFTDDQTHFTAYKDRRDSACYLEKLNGDRTENGDNSIQRERKTPKVLYVPNETLTKLEAWRIVGGRIVDFCRGFNIYLLQENKPIAGGTMDPFLNEVPVDENDIATRRVADVVLVPLLSRAKREILLENREKLNKIQETVRTRRQAAPYRGRFRGQTQSQYLSMGNDEKSAGKAEAEATEQSSRAVVAGNHGMGQAQSMSSGGSGCEDCPGYHPDYSVHVDQMPGKLQIQGPVKDGQYVNVPGTVRGPGSLITGGYPGGYPGGTVPGTRPTGITGQYPGGAIPGTAGPGGTIPGAPGYPRGVQQPPGTYPGVPVGPGNVIPGYYPGYVVPRTGGPTTGETYPGGHSVLIPGGVATYPGSIGTGSGTTGTGIRYTGGTLPGTTSTGTGVGYPNGVPIGTGTAGIDGRYPNGAPIGIGITGTGGGYPSGVATGTGTTGGGVSYPGGIAPTREAGMYPTAISSGTVTAGSGVTYPAGVVRGTPITGSDVTYPGGTGMGITATGSGGTYPGAFIPGTLTPGIVGTYPSGVAPGTVSTVVGGTYPSGVAPGALTPGLGGTYPGSFPGGTIIPGGTPQAIRRPGEGYPIEVSYPGGTGGVTHPSRVRPGVTTGGHTGITYPITTDGTGTYPAGMPGTIVTGDGTYPGNIITTDRKPAPGTGILPNIVTSAKTDVGTTVSFPGGGQYPQRQMPSGSPTGVDTGITGQQTGAVQPGITGFIAPGTTYPGAPLPGSGATQVTYPSGSGYPASLYPSSGGGGQPVLQYPPSGQLPGVPTDVSGTLQYPGVQYQPGQYPGINQYYPSGTSGQVTIPGQGIATGVQGYGVGQYPRQYPGQHPGLDANGGTLEPSQYYQTPKDTSATSAEDDGADSQASSSVKQVDAGTEASASAQGKYGQGTAQSQVSGIYSGTASFSAQAGTSDINRSAQAEISGGKDGAASNAEGVAGRGKSQAQVQLNSDSGSTSTGAQSSGWNHGTNSQVQASSKGGMADAQANGEGNTSSQAQIGFQPYLKDDDKVERHSTPFHGGGTASAQSGTHRGQSQSQLQGSFQYGITYTGAAQAGSGSGAATSRKPFNFNLTNPELRKPKVPYKPDNTPSISKTDVTDEATISSDVDFNRIQKQRQGLLGSSSSRQTVLTTAANEKVETAMTKQQSVDNSGVEEPIYNDNEYVDDYEDDYDSLAAQNPPVNLDTSSSHKKSESQHQSQTIQIGNANHHDVRVTQASSAPRIDDKLQPGQSLPGYTIPTGFRGVVKSVAGEDTIAQGDRGSQSQTVALIPNEPNVTHDNRPPASESRSQFPNSFLTRDLNRTVRPSYYTVTNSVTGKIDGKRNSQKKYEHRYYTKTSTCGYFAFSCNIVYGSDGRTKICKPKIPTYPDGTPMKC